jgi:hypothetical protein
MKNLSMFIATLVVAVPAIAADPLPKPVADMECLIGHWKGGGTLALGKDKSKIDATWTCQRTSAQFGVLCQFHVTGIPGVAAYDETDLMGYEPNSNLYHWYSVTNAGETHDHVAKVPDGNTIQFIYTGTQEGKSFKEVIDLAFSNDSKAVTGRAQTFVGGASTSIMDIKLRK